MKFARIENGTVCEITEMEPSRFFSPAAAAHFVVCDDNVRVGMTYSGGAFEDPEEREYEQSGEELFQIAVKAMTEKLLLKTVLAQAGVSAFSATDRSEVAAMYAAALAAKLGSASSVQKEILRKLISGVGD